MQIKIIKREDIKPGSEQVEIRPRPPARVVKDWIAEHRIETEARRMRDLKAFFGNTQTV